MATSAQINAIADAILVAFNSDAALFAAYLKRAKLETDLAQIESTLRKTRAAATAASSANEVTLQQLEAQRLAKLGEIDAL